MSLLQVLDAVYESGCTFWDTADVYGDNEELIGKWCAYTSLNLLSHSSASPCPTRYVGSRRPESATKSSLLRSSDLPMESLAGSSRPTQSTSRRPSTSLCPGWESITSTSTTSTVLTPRFPSNTPLLRWPSSSSELWFHLPVRKSEP